MVDLRRSVAFPTETRTAVVVGLIATCVGLGQALVTTSGPVAQYVAVALWYVTLVGLPTVLLLRYTLVTPVLAAGLLVVRPAVFGFDFGRFVAWPALFATVLVLAALELLVRTVFDDERTAVR